jgi:ankyrin repeat protein
MLALRLHTEEIAIASVAGKGDTAKVRNLLERGVSHSSRGFFDSTPLMQAEEGGHDEIMRLLLDQSALVLGEDHYHE